MLTITYRCRTTIEQHSLGSLLWVVLEFSVNQQLVAGPPWASTIDLAMDRPRPEPPRRRARDWSPLRKVYEVDGVPFLVAVGVHDLTCEPKRC
jgi:hypothetical protein